MNVHFVGDLKSIHFTLGGHDYAFFNGMSLTFGQAVEHCEAAGGNLASINSHTENEYIRGKIGTAHVWIGYFRDEAVIGRWNWIDGSGGYTNWDAVNQTVMLLARRTAFNTMAAMENGTITDAKSGTTVQEGKSDNRI